MEKKKSIHAEYRYDIVKNIRIKYHEILALYKNAL